MSNQHDFLSKKVNAILDYSKKSHWKLKLMAQNILFRFLIVYLQYVPDLMSQLNSLEMSWGYSLRITVVLSLLLNSFISAFVI